jgi:Ras-related protein Rab-18
MTEAGTVPISTYKLLLMGDSGVGKSSILLRFVEDRFLGEEVHAATIGSPLPSFHR